MCLILRACFPVLHSITLRFTLDPFLSYLVSSIKLSLKEKSFARALYKMTSEYGPLSSACLAPTWANWCWEMLALHHLSCTLCLHHYIFPLQLTSAHTHKKKENSTRWYCYVHGSQCSRKGSRILFQLICRSLGTHVPGHLQLSLPASPSR